MTADELMSAMLAWWRGGDALMPVILCTSLVLYARIGSLAWRLWADRPAMPEDALSAAMRELLFIRVLTAALPLLGLLGTVAGMVQTFADLARSGGAGTDAAAGIGLALTATQYGIALATPAVLSEVILRRRSQVLRAQAQILVRPVTPC